MKENFQVYDKSKNIVFYLNTKNLDCEFVSSLCEKYQNEFCDKFGIRNVILNEKVEIYIFDNREDFLQFNAENKTELADYCLKRNYDYKFTVGSIIFKLIYNLIKQNFLDKGLCNESIAQAIASIYRDKVSNIDSKNYEEHKYLKNLKSLEIVDDNSVNMIKDIIICNYLMQHNMFSNLMLNEELYNSQKEKLFQEAKHYFDKKYNVEFVPRNYDEVKNIYDLLRFMDRNISVGYIDNKGQVHYDTYKNIHMQYKLARIDEILDKKVGTCAEQAKLIKYFLDSRNIENKVFYCASYNGTLNKDENYENIMCQHLLVFAKYKGKWNYIEQAYSTHQGIFQFNNLTDALTEGAKEFFFWDNFELYEINDIKDGLSFVEMYDYFSSCKPIEWSGNNVKDFRVNYKEANNLYSTELYSKK